VRDTAKRPLDEYCDEARRVFVMSNGVCLNSRVGLTKEAVERIRAEFTEIYVYPGSSNYVATEGW
jgi:hypothetical protein